ncbi:hypothetical protein [Terasakiispira papahanaumokuakeensis]|nr:hypothetical protein [Terasakiispira papahanaumokuakeensis]
MTSPQVRPTSIRVFLTDDTPTLYLNERGAQATGREVADGFVVHPQV